MDAGPQGGTGDTKGLHRYVASWHPEAVTDRDDLPVGPAATLAALLDQSPPAARAGDALPPLWHWVYFLTWPAQSALGADGHPREGRFLPPVPDRRRMMAGGRATFRAPVRAGVPAERVSALAGAEVKQGRTGEMLFVTVRSEIRQDGEVCLTEEQDVVYRSGEDPRRRATLPAGTSAAPPPDAAWQLAMRPGPPLLFRFSALTANAHRIHYDAPYARDVEGYPGLVVHGPLLVLWMMELLRRNAPGLRVRTVSWRLRRPVFAGEEVLAAGDPPRDGRAVLRIATGREARHATAEVVAA